MLSPVPNRRRAFAAQAAKLSCTGPRDDEIRLLRRAALEYSSALEHKAARFPCNLPDDPLEADERGRLRRHRRRRARGQRTTSTTGAIRWQSGASSGALGREAWS